MKIYKLDIDTSKPTRQVVAMQQNSTGVLSVDVANDGKYIRNLSCSLYEDGNEISATADNGYKIEMGGETKAVKFVAKSTPIESPREYVLSSTSGNRLKNFWANLLVVPEGVYNQDEFAPIIDLYTFGDKPYPGTPKILTIHGTSEGKANFKFVRIMPYIPYQQIWFYDADNNILPSDEPIVVSSEISAGVSFSMKATQITLSSETYPAVGYYTNYRMDTIIKPSQNAACYAEYDIAEPVAPDVSSDISSDLSSDGDLSSDPE